MAVESRVDAIGALRGGVDSSPAKDAGRHIAPAKREIDRALREVAERFAPIARNTILYQNRYKHRYEVARILAAAGRSGAVCDLGGGVGVNLLVLRALGCDGRLVLVDKFEEYDAANHMGRSDESLRLLADADVEVLEQDFWREPRLPLESGSFDVATSFDVIEHLPGHPLRQLGELHRILKRGGTCVIGAPNGVSLMKRLRVLIGRYPYSPMEEWLKDAYTDHFREYTRAEYEELLRRAGFSSIRSYASAAVTHARARHRYHRGRLGYASPRLAALAGLAVVEAVVPGLRHSVYASGVRGDN